MPTPSAPASVERLLPPGGKRSSKRELIVGVFLRQQGHLSADDLVERISRDHKKISRATVYRTLQWMVGAGIARKVDFGEGLSRFEPTYRHPRHFHLVCRTCSQSFEFLSSDIEALVDEVVRARHFAREETVLQVYGTCDACRAGRTPAGEPATELLFARDALRIAIATERSGLQFYSQAATSTRDTRGRRVFRELAQEERNHLRTLEERYANLIAKDPGLESRPTFLFFKGAANTLFAAGAERISSGVTAGEALRIGIRCERRSHLFFKRYAGKFEDSEGKRIFLEFADEERAHMELLLREYQDHVRRRSRAPASVAARPVRGDARRRARRGAATSGH